MTKFEVLGIKRKERTAKTSGRVYVGVNLYLAYEDPSIEGLGCIDVFTTNEIIPIDLRVGDSINLFYNRFGKIESVNKCG